MRRVRNYFQTTMSSQCFSSLGLLYIERDLARNIKAPDVVAEFISNDIAVLLGVE